MTDRPIVPVSFAATTTQAVITTGFTRLMGWAFKETTGAAGAAGEVFDGQDATGQSVLPFTLLTNESFRDWLGPNGLLCERGIFVQVTSGTVRGVLYVELLPADAFYDILAAARPAGS